MGASLNKIVDVQVEVSNPSTISTDFNLGLIVGKSTAILTQKVKVYSIEDYTTEMISDGFTAASTEYLAAQAYFAQSPNSSQVAIGAIDVENNETPAEALTAIRAANDKFYSVCFSDVLSTTEVAAVAAAVEAFSTPTIFFYQTDDDNCTKANTTNIMKTLQDSSYNRSFGFYASAELYVAAAVSGLVSGLNSMAVNSAYTVAYKTLASVTPEDLTDEQLSNIVSYNGNAYSTFGNRYNFVYPGVSAKGYHVDEVYMIDASTYLIQQNVISGLVSARKIPQTEDGMNTLVSFINAACGTLANVGMIASGIWKGDAVGGLNTGDAIPGGYYVEAGRISDQSAADRISRKSPPIYVALLSSGAIEHVVIRVFVNR